jgi:hypothetical protein
MKKTLLLSLVLGLLLATGCKPSTRVAFKPAMVSIDVGPGWARLDIPADPPACTPRLMGKAGMINAVLIEGDNADLKRAVNALRFTGRPSEGSFKQEDFSTASGLNGIHVSYSATSEKSTTPDLRSHNFIVMGAGRRCVSISYITSPELESAAVLAAIQKTLQVE